MEEGNERKGGEGAHAVREDWQAGRRVTRRWGMVVVGSKERCNASNSTYPRCANTSKQREHSGARRERDDMRSEGRRALARVVAEEAPASVSDLAGRVDVVDEARRTHGHGCASAPLTILEVC